MTYWTCLTTLAPILSYTVTQVAFYVDSNGDGQLDTGDTLLGYGTQSGPGVWTFTHTAGLAPGSYTLLAQAEGGDGVFGDHFALTLVVQEAEGTAAPAPPVGRRGRWSAGGDRCQPSFGSASYRQPDGPPVSRARAAGRRRRFG
jgi:hypothetical protein